jgi:hypothetical protein
MGANISGDSKRRKRILPTPTPESSKASIKAFNRTCNQDVLDAYLFEEPYQFQGITEKGPETYNLHRPHESYNTPHTTKIPIHLKAIGMLKTDRWFPTYQPCRNFQINCNFTIGPILWEVYTFHYLGNND